MIDRGDLSPDDPPPTTEQRIQWVRAFWELVDVGRSDAGETALGGLAGIRADVERCLMRQPPDVTRAEGLTAYAALVMTGQTIS